MSAFGKVLSCHCTSINRIDAVPLKDAGSVAGAGVCLEKDGVETTRDSGQGFYLHMFLVLEIC